MTIDQIRKKMSEHRGERVKITFNGTRNRVEKFDAVIKQTYPFVFVVQLDSQKALNETKSFSYSDVLTQIIELEFS